MGHAAHQSSQVLPVCVKGDLFHATYGKKNNKMMQTKDREAMKSTEIKNVVMLTGHKPPTNIQGSIYIELSHLAR